MYSRTSQTEKEPEGQRGSELSEVLYLLQTLRDRYGGLLNRLDSVGHVLLNTNFPTEAKLSQKEETETGAIVELRKECLWIDIGHNRLEETILKMEKII